MGIVFSVMQALHIALKLGQGGTAREDDELAVWIFMFLTRSFSGRLESVMDTM